MTSPVARVAALDWPRIEADLDAAGHAAVDSLLTPGECEAAAALYDEPGRFRSRVVMARHGFGRGEYQYFAYPLPDMGPVPGQRRRGERRHAPASRARSARLRSTPQR